MNPRQGMWSVGAPPLHKAYLACHLWSGNVRERTRTGILRSNCNQTTVLNHPRQRSCEIPILTCVPPDAVLSVLVHDEIDPDVPPAVRQTVPPGQLAREAGHLRHALERERLHPDPVVRVARARVRPGRQQDVKPSTATSDAAGHAGRRQPRHSGTAPRPTRVRTVSPRLVEDLTPGVLSVQRAPVHRLRKRRLLLWRQYVRAEAHPPPAAEICGGTENSKACKTRM